MNAKRPSILVPIITGFGLMLLLLLAVTAIGYAHIRTLSQQLNAIVIERNEKSGLAAKLRALHEARHHSLLLSAHLVDAFERDEETMHFQAMARDFIVLRDRFLALPLDHEEMSAWTRVRAEVREVEQLSEQVLDLLGKNQATAAHRLIQNQLAPRQAHMMDEWRRLEALQQDFNQRAVVEASRLRTRALSLTLGLSAAVILTGSLVAVFVIRRSRRLETDLFEEKELAQVTLRNIADAVIRFDERCRLMFLNPVAEHMLGVKATNCLGRPVSECLRLNDRQSGLQLVPELLDQTMLGKTVTLPGHSYQQTPDNAEREVEGRCSPVHTPSGEIVGGVLVLRDVGEARQLQRKLTWLADHDDLSGLHNRRSFERHLLQILTSRRSSDYPLSVFYIDLDLFKPVNDQAGHAAGDELLRQLSQRMLACLRTTDLFARLGGDEFGAILAACPDEVAEQLAETLRTTIAEFKLDWLSRQYQVSASIGVVHVPSHWEDLDACLAAADRACYQAKQLGRDQVWVYQP